MKATRNKFIMTLVLAAATASGACGKADRGRGSETSAPSAAPASTGAGGAGAESGAFVPSDPPEVRLRSELATAAKVDSVTATRLAGISPVLKCVETLPDDRLRAHFGVDNRLPGDEGKKTMVPIGFYNRFWPPPIAQGQPTSFEAGVRQDAAQVVFAKNATVAWVLGANFSLATAASPACPEKAHAGSTLVKGERSSPRKLIARP